MAAGSEFQGGRALHGYDARKSDKLRGARVKRRPSHFAMARECTQRRSAMQTHKGFNIGWTRHAATVQYIFGRV